MWGISLNKKTISELPLTVTINHLFVTIPGTDTSSDPGVTNNVDTTPKKSKVRYRLLQTALYLPTFM